MSRSPDSLGVIGSASHAGRCDELNEAPWERRHLAGRRCYIAISGQNAYETLHACLLSLLAAETAAFPRLNPPGKHDSHFQLHPDSLANLFLTVVKSHPVIHDQFA